ncbi:MAG: hypothetical protein IRZ15_05170 [Bryobacteraceae bacterium]|nr:hypothetical protein [Bryobacteraceae bacterium]
MQEIPTSKLDWGVALRYAVMVAIPLLGMAVTVHVGKDLTAPPVLEGRWKIEREPALPPSVCEEQLAWLQSGEFVLMQQGQSLTAMPEGRPDLALEGKVTGSELRFFSPLPSSGLSIHGRLSKIDGVARLDARIEHAGEAPCSALSFRARHNPGPEGSGRRGSS